LLNYEHKAEYEREMEQLSEEEELVRELKYLRVWLLEEMERFKIPQTYDGDDEEEDEEDEEDEASDANMSKIVEGDYYRWADAIKSEWIRASVR
jgi:hypothetical protein